MVAGFFGGVLGGMGMGGGTLLIPILTVILTVFQHEAQGINLLSFIPMAIITVVMHAKNKMITWRYALLVMLPAIASSVISSLFSAKLTQSVLSTSFGVFLIALGVFQMISELIKLFKNGSGTEKEEEKGTSEAPCEKATDNE